MNKAISSIFLTAAVALSLYAAFKPAEKPSVQVVEQPVAATPSPEHFNQEYFYNGLSTSKLYGLSSVNASTTTTTPIQLGSGSHGQITVGTSTPAIRIQNASTTAITATSMVFLQQISTTTMPSVTCNATQATNTQVSLVFASSTNSSMNGFQITLGSIPATNPACFNYWIVDRSKAGY